MKRLVSLITLLALMFQLTALGSFAASDKAVFTGVAEAYGVYAIDKNHTSLNVFSAKKLEHIYRDYNTTKFTLNTATDYKATSIKYTLSKDKKSVAAKVVYADKTVSDYTFKKDKAGKVYLEFPDATGVTKKISKTYTSLDLATKYVKSDKFKAILKLEAALVKEINSFNADIKTIRSAYDDAGPISDTNFIEGLYVGDSEDDTLDIFFACDFDADTYKNFSQLLDTTLTIGDDAYHIYGANFGIEDNLMTIAEDDDNYINLTTTDRSTITHISVVLDGKTAYDEDVNFQLDTKYTN